MRDSTPQKGPTSSSQEDLPQGSANIAVALRHAISSGHYKFGEKLPTERELAERFRTSRGTIREALRQLEGLKMVRRRRGSGTFVTFLSEDAGSEVVNMTSPIELIDVRAALEPRMAHLAAINASNNDIERIRGALAQLVADLDLVLVVHRTGDFVAGSGDQSRGVFQVPVVDIGFARVF